MFAARTPGRLDAVTASLAWCRATIEAIIYPKRSSTRRDTYHVVSACTHGIVASPSMLFTSAPGVSKYNASEGLYPSNSCMIPHGFNYGREEWALKLWCTCSAVSKEHVALQVLAKWLG